jgi:hypothetical protein
MDHDPANGGAAMTSDRGKEFGFAAAHDAPIPYLQRILDNYKALGYDPPYEWAHYSEVPFRPLDKPLSKSRGHHHHHGGSLSAFHGAPTNRSHRVTLEADCPEIVARCKADGV